MVSIVDNLVYNYVRVFSELHPIVRLLLKHDIYI